MNAVNDPSDFEPGDLVIYIPVFAKGDINHSCVEHGTVTKINDTYVFVRFHSGEPGVACYASTLQKK
jgi:hypothetical protein